MNQLQKSIERFDAQADGVERWLLRSTIRHWLTKWEGSPPDARGLELHLPAAVRAAVEDWNRLPEVRRRALEWREANAGN